MGNKIFASYKYWDTSVYQDRKLDLITHPQGIWFGEAITPRSYLNKLTEILCEQGEHIDKWENDSEDLSNFKDDYIESQLKNKIFDSSVTIVLISPYMKDTRYSEKDQWIPWEISYSLRKVTRSSRTSQTNAIVAVVLPDCNNSYNYCIEHDYLCNIHNLYFQRTFSIIGGNFFNKKDPIIYTCNACNAIHYRGYNNHYFAYAKWENFIASPKSCIDQALENQKNQNLFNIQKTIV